MKKTTYKIFDSPAGKTIVFNNLYLINGEFIFNGTVSDSEVSTYHNVHYRHTNFEMWKPKIVELSISEETVKLIKNPHFYFKETLRYHPVHTLMDDIFSVFYSLYRCKINYDPITCIVETLYNEFPYECKGYFKLLFGQDAMPLSYLKNIYTQVCFETFVVGNSGSGLSSFDANFASPFEDNIWQQFRDAFYKKAEIELESGTNIIYVNRHPDEDNLEDELKKTLKKNNIKIVNWGGKDIKEQLNIIKNVKVYITSEGSSALNAIFLPDNAIVIDLGRLYECGNYKTVCYGNDYIFPSLPYIDVLYFEDYYPLKIKETSICPEPNNLMEMIEVAFQANHPLLITRKDIYTKFASKVVDKIAYAIKVNNYSPDARLLLETYPEVVERSKIIETFKCGNLSFACIAKIGHLKTK